jgi:hypothetical protein
MRSSRLHHGNNKELLAQIKDGNFSGLNRTSFSKIRIPGLSAAVAAYLTARIFSYFCGQLLIISNLGECRCQSLNITNWND